MAEFDTITTTVEVELEIRPPTDGASKFDPLSQTFAEAKKDGLHVKSKVTNIRGNDAPDVLTEFGSISNDNQVGVFLPANKLIAATETAIATSGEVDMPNPNSETTPTKSDRTDN